MSRLSLLAAVLCVGATVDATAAVWEVEPGTGNVQETLDNQAASGDTLVLLDGLFRENIVLPVGDWTILAENPGSAVLDGGLKDESVLVATGGNLVLSGLVIQGGRGHLISELLGIRAGAGVCFVGGQVFSTLRAVDCVFQNNELHGESDWNGGGIYAEALVSVEINRCSFVDNVISGDGSAIFLDGGPTDCTVVDSRFGSEGHPRDRAIFTGPVDGELRVSDCEFVGPGTIGFPGGNTIVTRSVFLGALVSFSDWVASGGNIECSHNLIVGNDESDRSRLTTLIVRSRFKCQNNTIVYMDVDINTHARSGVIFSENIVFGSQGWILSSSGGTVSCCVQWPELLTDLSGTLDTDENTVVLADPKFCDEIKWQLKDTSPCLPENSHEDCTSTIGARPSCAGVPVIRQSWGQVKRAFGK